MLNIYEKKLQKECNNKNNLSKNKLKLKSFKGKENKDLELFVEMYHELRTPLNVILGSLQLLDVKIKNKKIIDDDRILDVNLDMIKLNSLRLLKLVNNIIDLNKIDLGHISLELKCCNIVSFVEDLVDSVALYAKNKNINMIFDTEKEEIISKIDLEKMERVVLNILSNAIKFTNSNGNILVNVFEKNNNIYISIKDSGIGIDADKVGLVFEKYKQFNSEYASVVGGSGIGLSLAKNIVELHNGKISVESKVNVGSEFLIEIPINYDKQDEKEVIESKCEIAKIEMELSDICYKK